MPYTIINHNRFSRLTHQTVDYMQTQYVNCERVRYVETLPDNATEGDLAYNTTDHIFYGYNGSEWQKMVVGELPFSDLEPLLKNITDASKTGRFDLSGVSADTIRVLKFPDKDGIIATIADLPATNRGFSPVDDATYDLGNASHRYKDAYLSGNLTVGTVDGVDISAHKHTGSDGSVRIESTDLGVTGGANGNLLQVADGKLAFVQPSTITGLLGSSGPSGYSGYSGYSGSQGIMGPSGLSGFSGWSGRAGVDLTVPTNIFYPTHTDSSNGYYTMSVNDPNDAYLIYETYSAGTYMIYGAVSDVPANPTILPGDYQFSIWFNRSFGSGTVSANVKLLYWSMDPFQVESEIGSYTISSIPQGVSTQKFNISVAYPVTISANRRLAIEVYVTVPSTNDVRIQSNSGYWFTIITPNYKPGSSGFSGYSGQSGASGISGWSGKSGYSGWSGRSGYSGWSGFSGISGISGLSGYSGYSGYSGISGYSGFSGISGHSGINGSSGYSGFSGFSGISGATGQTGVTGTSGWSGKSGYSGFSGYSGISGASGTSGSSGFSGYSGYSGMGFSGYSGYSGTSGHSGISGPRGATGAQGSQGDQGPQGASGYSGYSGYSGQAGVSGPSGPQGSQGAQGAQGPTGLSGYSGWSGISGYSGWSGTEGASGISGWSGWSGTNGSGNAINVPDYIITNESGTYKAYLATTGAVAASGTTASTVIQAAATALSSGGVIAFKRGAYTLTAKIALSSGTLVDAQGSVFDVTGLNDTVFEFGTNTIAGWQWNINTTNGEKQTGLRNANFNGDLTNTSTKLVRICQVNGGAIAENILGKRVANYIEIVGACYGALVRNVKGHYMNGTFIKLLGEYLTDNNYAPNDTHIDSCEMSAFYSTAIGVWNGDDGLTGSFAAENVTISNCYIEGVNIGVYTDYKSTKITNSFIDASTASGDTRKSIMNTSAGSNLLVSNCVVSSATSTSVAFELNASYLISNCRFDYISGIGVSVPNGDVYGRISNCYFSINGSATATNAIYGQLDYSAIIGCSFMSSGAVHTGISLMSGTTHLAIIGCQFSNLAYGITGTASGVTMIGNAFPSCTIGVNFNALSHYSLVGNEFYGATGAVASHTSFTNDFANSDYVIRKSGTATIASGGTSIAVTHGLAVAPTKVTCTGSTADTAALYVTSIDATTFTINATSAVGGSRTVYWYAEC